MTKSIIKNYDPADITHELLYETDDWSIIELNYNLDADKLNSWYTAFREEFNDLHFRFDENPHKLNLEVSADMVKQGFCGIYCGPIQGLTMAWPTERYEPLPPPKQANPEAYPEVNHDTFMQDAKIMRKFRKGYIEEVINTLGEDSFRQMIITTHFPTMKILQHVDSRVLKLHIPLETNEHAYFHFGEHKELGQYNMKVGKIYVLNSGDWHGTSNEGDTRRSHIITRITPMALQHILKLTN